MESIPFKTSTIVSRDNFQRIHRITREKRSLWYQLTVLQQPERARACGAGMKANSDRRPVDPPPVVELRIIEGPSVEQGKDITFDYNANFFLYASLEQARPMAHGRLQTPATLNPPILTGVPASGMAYLDRPCEAGYFIFPDLSVRHEGYFRLSFSLFETTKEERDFDLEPASDMPPGVDWRMEIKTVPFNVFSAKKFPGLMESTPLSKIVADQGCRVRIRRDVRMRKRDTKPGSTSHDARQEAHRKPASAPKPNLHPRDRSLDSSSDHASQYPAAQPDRRISALSPTDPRSAQPPPPPPPPVYDPVAAAASARHLSFGTENAAPVSVAAPGSLAHAPAPMQPSSHVDADLRPRSSHVAPIREAPQQQQQQQQQPLHSPSGSELNRTFAFPPISTVARPSPSPLLPPGRPETYEPRRSLSHLPISPSSYSPRDYHSRRDSYATQPATPTCLGPRPLLPEPRCSNAPLKISSLVSPVLPPIEVQTEPLPTLPDILTGGKRKHEIVFDQASSPLHNGQRQLDLHHKIDRSRILPEPHMYTRADGKVCHVQFNTYN